MSKVKLMLGRIKKFSRIGYTIKDIPAARDILMIFLEHVDG